MTTHEPGVIAWRKSTFSNGASACVEVGWRKSSFSNGGNACVEIALRRPGVGVRDSKYQAGPTLDFPTSDWRTFLTTL
jgi:hypothetical protein